MIQLTRIFLLSLLLLSCSKKVKYIDKEVNVNIVPLAKEVDIIESNKHILLPKKISKFVEFYWSVGRIFEKILVLMG